MAIAPGKKAAKKAGKKTAKKAGKKTAKKAGKKTAKKAGKKTAKRTRAAAANKAPLRLLDSLKRMPATQFENLVYDLAVLRGLQNVIWRTPGADGGRDIEGTFVRQDYSDHFLVEKWYIECKRYQTTLDWPAVRGKIAYAINHRADGLLLATTALVSPQCKTEIQTYNLRGERPLIRLWEGPTLEEIVRKQAPLLVKYGFANDSERSARAYLELALATTKAIHSTYSRLEGTAAVDPALEFASAAADLLLARFAASEAGHTWRPRGFVASRDTYPWARVTGTATTRLDRSALRAILAFIHYAASGAPLDVSLTEASATITPTTRGPSVGSPAYTNTLRLFAFWASATAREASGGVLVEEQ